MDRLGRTVLQSVQFLTSLHQEKIEFRALTEGIDTNTPMGKFYFHMAAALAESRDTLEEVVEPFLIQEGLVLRTPRGRMLGEPGWRHLGLIPPAGVAVQPDLLTPGSET